MKIHWNGFLEQAVKNFPCESCAFLYSKKPYSPEEEWFVFPVRNDADNRINRWKPLKKDLMRVRQQAIKQQLVKIGNIHTHPYVEGDIEGYFEPSELDLKYARKFNDTIRGIIVVGKNAIHGIRFHDKFGNKVEVLVIENV